MLICSSISVISSTGMLILNVVPLPIVLVTSSSPFKKSMYFLDRFKASPVVLPIVEVYRSVSENGSNITLSLLEEIPAPVSVIFNLNWFFSEEKTDSYIFPLSVNLKEVVIKLRRMYLNF